MCWGGGGGNSFEVNKLRLKERIPDSLLPERQTAFSKIIKEIKRLFTRMPSLKNRRIERFLSTYMRESWIAQEDFLHKLCRMTAETPDFQRIATPDVYMIAISVLLEENDFGKAAKLLSMYMKKFGQKHIEKFMMVSDLCEQICPVNSKIQTSASVFRMLKEFEQQDARSFFAGKSIAIVGNGPSQLNKGTGREIDQHDIVIRFNDFSTEEKFNVDYGQKTTVWGTIFSKFTQENIGKCQLPIIYASGTHRIIDHISMEGFEHFLQRTRFFVVPDNVLKKLVLESHINDPTTGVRVVYWLKTHLNADIDLYGFTLNATQTDDYMDSALGNHHYFEHASCTHHNFNKESKFLARLLTSGSESKTSICQEEFPTSRGRTSDLLY